MLLWMLAAQLGGLTRATHLHGLHLKADDDPAESAIYGRLVDDVPYATRHKGVIRSSDTLRYLQLQLQMILLVLALTLQPSDHLRGLCWPEQVRLVLHRLPRKRERICGLSRLGGGVQPAAPISLAYTAGRFESYATDRNAERSTVGRTRHRKL